MAVNWLPWDHNYCIFFIFLEKFYRFDFGIEVINAYVGRELRIDFHLFAMDNLFYQPH